MLVIMTQLNNGTLWKLHFIAIYFPYIIKELTKFTHYFVRYKENKRTWIKIQFYYNLGQNYIYKILNTLLEFMEIH